MIRSIHEYCCPLWHPTLIGATQNIEALQKNFTRKIQGCQAIGKDLPTSSLCHCNADARALHHHHYHVEYSFNDKHPNDMNIRFQHPKRNGITARLTKLNKTCTMHYQTMYDSSFAVQGPKLWNHLPAGMITQIPDLILRRSRLDMPIYKYMMHA